MTSFLTWLKQKLSPDEAMEDIYDHRAGDRISPAPRKRKKPKIPTRAKKEPAQPVFDNLEYSADDPQRIEDGGPGKNVLVRNRYIREDTGTHETLKIVDDSILESAEAKEFDPYNTGRFDRSKSWDAPSRKK